MNRTIVASLTLSASALVGLAVHEGYREEAYYATEHERERKISTIGFGDAQGVKPGQKTDPVRALIRLNQQVNVFEHGMRECIGDVPMFQHEWNSYVALTFNIGLGKEGVKDGFCYVKRGGNSTIVQRLKAGDYAGACAGILAWDKQNGKPIAGLTKRRQDEYRKCMGLK
jgi:lysozyme